MPVIKLSLTDSDYQQLLTLANEEHMSIQDFIRYKLLSKKTPIIFTPERALELALEKYSKEDAPFSLPDIYGEDWYQLDPRMTGAFGKRFFNFSRNVKEIQFAGMTPDGRRATYRVT